MRKLDSVIKSLSKQEIRNFKIYTNRIKTNNRQKKILLLFDAYRSAKYKSDEDLILGVFPDLNKNAFYRLRNRLLDEIDQSLLMLYNDMDEKIIVTRCIMLAKISYHKDDYKSAYSLLNEAERLAYKNEFYDILNVIYNEIISLSSYFPEIDPRTYIKKISEAEKRFATLNELNRLIAEISYDLRSRNYDKGEPDTIEKLKKINERLEQSEIIKSAFSAKLKAFTCIRDILQHEKKYNQLKDYLIETYNSFEGSNLFSRPYHEDKIELLIWIINTLHRTSEFSLSLKYTELLKEELTRYNKLSFEKYQAHYYRILFSSLYYKGNIQDAIGIMLEYRYTEMNGDKIDYSNHPSMLIILIQANLTVANFALKNYDTALEEIKHFFYADIFRKLSPQFKLYIFIIEIFLHFEKGDSEFVLARIKEVKRNLRNLLSKDDYAREKELLNILRKMVLVNDALKNKTILKRIQDYIDNSPEFVPGTNEGINYRVFLESKLNKMSYYDTVMTKLKDSPSEINID